MEILFNKRIILISGNAGITLEVAIYRNSGSQKLYCQYPVLKEKKIDLFIQKILMKNYSKFNKQEIKKNISWKDKRISIISTKYWDNAKSY